MEMNLLRVILFAASLLLMPTAFAANLNIPSDIQVAAMETKTSGSLRNDGSWMLSKNSSVSQAFNLTAGTTYRVSIGAYGTPLGGVGPKMVVTVDSDVVQTIMVESLVLAQYDFSFVAKSSGPQLVRIAFTNDKTSSREDRNLFLRTLRITSDTASSVVADLEVRSMENKTSGKLVSDGSWVLTKNSSVSQTFDFTAGATYQMSIGAYGTPLGGIGPRMVVYVDSDIVQTIMVDNLALAQHDFSFVALSGGPKTVRIAFTNDKNSPREDRNLYLKSLKIVSSGGGTVTHCTVAPFGTVLNGASVRAFQAVPNGQSCASEMRVCNNGVLSGSFTQASCTVTAPPAASCTLPFGGSLNSGQSIDAYQASSVPNGSTCVSEIRNCSNGNLSGSFVHGSCSVSAPTPVPPVTGNIIAEDNFESGRLSSVWNGPRADMVVRLPASTGRSGYAMEFFYPGVADNEDGWAEARFDLKADYAKLAIEFDLFVPSNYFHRVPGDRTNNNKFFRLWQRTYDDVEKLGASMMSEGSSGNSTIGSDYRIESSWGISTAITESRSFITSADRGKWMSIRIEVIAATDTTNGSIKIYKNDALHLSDTKIKNHVRGTQGFRYGYLLGWANSGFSQDTRLYVDNLRVLDLSTQ